MQAASLSRISLVRPRVLFAEKACPPNFRCAPHAYSNELCALLFGSALLYRG